MQKVSVTDACGLSESMGRELYCANPFWLVENCFWEEINGERVVFVRDRVDEKIYPLFVPKKVENQRVDFVEMATREEVDDLRAQGLRFKETHIGTEYHYLTRDVIEMKGRRFAAFRKRVHKFKQGYEFKVLSEYPKERVVQFIEDWAKTKDLKSYEPLARSVFLWDLDNCINYVSLIDKLPCKNIFVEVDGTLAGFAMTCALTKDTFVALQQKVDVSYVGLSRFLYHAKAKLWPRTEFFTVGTEGHTPGLALFKEELHPAKKIDLYFLSFTKDAA